MKHFIMLVVTLLLTTLTFSQNKLETLEKQSEKIVNSGTNGISTVYSDTKQGVSTIYNDVKSLAPDAKETLKYFYKEIRNVSIYTWDLLVRQQTTWSICYLLLEILFFITIYKFWKSFDKLKTDTDEAGAMKSINYIPMIGFLGASIFLFVFNINHFEPMVTGFYNPEYGALKTLIELKGHIK